MAATYSLGVFQGGKCSRTRNSQLPASEVRDWGRPQGPTDLYGPLSLDPEIPSPVLPSCLNLLWQGYVGTFQPSVLGRPQVGNLHYLNSLVTPSLPTPH